MLRLTTRRSAPEYRRAAPLAAQTVEQRHEPVDTASTLIGLRLNSHQRMAGRGCRMQEDLYEPLAMQEGLSSRRSAGHRSGRSSVLCGRPPLHPAPQGPSSGEGRSSVSSDAVSLRARATACSVQSSSLRPRASGSGYRRFPATSASKVRHAAVAQFQRTKDLDIGDFQCVRGVIGPAAESAISRKPLPGRMARPSTTCSPDPEKLGIEMVFPMRSLRSTRQPLRR